MILFSCVNDPMKVKSFNIGKDLPSQTSNDIDVYYSDSAKQKIHLTAPQADIYTGAKPYEEMTKGVNVEFYNDSSGKVESSLTAEYAIRREREQIMEAKRKVVVVNAAGDKLETEHLIWDGAKDSIFTKAFVKITTADQVLIGDGMVSDAMFNHYRIIHPTGVFSLNEAPDDSVSK
ncbi:MAG TPA: LPS export ABC transporter periplasmic protein LptC [Bacteroidia bacterium]|nr:LPS export ABC transporter periplasmic protein LptC [Bacteroidia bacterium]